MATEDSITSLLDPAAGAGPDIMNDPQYATNTGSGEDGIGDADTCRICRGEATEQEPLFYPCKCSGSIKFVHQDCLMEWLSHSQKKHCELCKTPFRFTKLYSPNMPQNLPTHVFFRHLIIHTIKNLAVWLRFCLVVFVWLGCLPWAMRHIWGFLFWFGDGGWSIKDIDTSSRYNNTSTARALEAIADLVLNDTITNGTSPASPLMTVPTTPKTVGKVMGHIPDLLKPFMKLFNLSRHERLPVGFFKSIFQGLPLPELNTTTPQHTSLLQSTIPGRSSLLSEVRFLKELTRYPRINSVIITTLEGQIITIVVVVCFVLVFLIREWVVQQQPGINMGAGFNAEFGGERGARNRNALPDNPPDAEGLPVDAVRNVEELQGGVPRPAADVAARPIARPRRRMVRFEDTHGSDASPANVDREVTLNLSPNVRQKAGDDAGEGSADGHHPRPGMLERDALSPAAEIQRHLAEESSKTQDRFDAGKFVSVWRRAGGSPEEVLRIIEAEGLGEKLRYWKNAMESLQADSALASSSDDRKSLIGTTSLHGSTDSLAAQCSDGTNSTNESWVDVPPPLSIHSHTSDSPVTEEIESSKLPTMSSKGKEKAVETLQDPLSDASNKISAINFAMPSGQLSRDNEASWTPDPISREGVIFQSGPRRPRAISDGPQPRESISPLAENYWSFSAVDPSPTAPTHEPPSVQAANEHQMEVRFPDEKDDGNSEHQMSNAPADDRGLVDVLSTEESHVLSPDTNDLIEIYNVQKGTTQTAESWDDVFANNPASDSEDDSQEIPEADANVEQNPFHPDGLLPEDLPPLDTRDTAPQRRHEPQGFLGHVANFLWGDLDLPQEVRAGDDEHIVQDIAAEAPFVPVAHHNHGIFDDNDSDDEDQVNPERDVVAGAMAAGVDPNDPDGLDDVEDFEGIMELVGMRGPLTALVQNGLFSAVLISLTVACGVWVPYNVGRFVLLLIANPIATVKLPLKFLFSFAAVLQDLALVAIGSLSYLLIHLCSLPKLLYSYTFASSDLSTLMTERPSPASESLRFATVAGERIVDGFVSALMQIPDSEVPAFSAVSHESLIIIKTVISDSLQYIGSFVTSLLVNPAAQSTPSKSVDFAAVWVTLSELKVSTGHALRALPKTLASAESWVITLDIPERAVPVDPSLSYWSGTDRFWAILAGYVAFSFLGAAYLRRGSPFSSSQTGREWEATIIDVLNQAGGVMKVILIISIEMLVFPLYCGLLLDIALLPLFENASLLSRALFTIETPLTSIFVHWFVGTCYMFHFALFVSMCRKIMRSGVLCKCAPHRQLFLADLF
jgi:E3 ubiquitin-protein ligase MARCH6